MNIKKTASLLINFTLNRLAEILGIIITLAGIFLFISLFSYSPDDPNFIYPEKQEINNILGINGSIGADFLFQSIGLISYFLPITLIFLSVTIIYQKNLPTMMEELILMGL